MHVIILPRRILFGQSETLWVLSLPSSKVNLQLVVHIIGGYRAAYLFNSVKIGAILIGVNGSVFIGLLLYGLKKFSF